MLAHALKHFHMLAHTQVHSGGVNGGHYYAFIRPDGKQWLKFDDEKVTKEDRRRAIDDSFGKSRGWWEGKKGWLVGIWW